MRVTGGRGKVTIVVPARNEAVRLPALLASLARLTYPDVEVVVVDDASTDGTAEVAEAAGFRVLRVPGPPPGWTGKAYACQAGAEATEGDWILFTDADTLHAAGSLERALAAAVLSGCGLFSLLTGQRCFTLWERLLLPYAYALYFVGARRLNRSGGAAVANGQYLLFRRAAYERIGGHAAVRGSIVEDVALAQLARDRGVGVLLMRGESEVQVRMYSGLAELWEGFGKNAFRFVSVSPRTGIPTVIAGLTFGATPLAARRLRSWPGRLLLLLVPAIALLPWERRFSAPPFYALLCPLAALLFQVLALDSMRRALTGATVWKGRRY